MNASWGGLLPDIVTPQRIDWHVVENAIEAVLTEAGISFRKTGRAERLEDFDQAPDFVVPNEFNPRIVIEAKLTEDDGTARDKVTRGPASWLSQHGRSTSGQAWISGRCLYCRQGIWRSP